MRHQYVGIGESCNPRPIQTRETQVKGQVFISLKTKQLNSSFEFFYIKQLAECGVWIFFLYSFCYDTIQNDLKTISQHETIMKF